MTKTPNSHRPIDYDDYPPLLRQATDLCETVFQTENRATTSPLCIVHGHNNTRCQLDLSEDLSSDAKKARLSVALTLLCCNQNINAVTMITESNMLAVHGDEDMADIAGEGEPKEILHRLRAAGYQPEFTECMTIMHEDRSTSYMAFATIQHDPDTKVRSLGSWECMCISQSDIPTCGDDAPSLQGFFARSQSLVDALIKADSGPDSH